MINAGVIGSTLNFDHIEFEQNKLHSSHFKYYRLHHHHHRRHYNHHSPHYRQHYHRVKIVSLTSTFLIQLFIATTIMAASSNPSVAMNILNDHIHVHDIDVRFAERMRSQISPKIFLNENRPSLRVSEEYRIMKIPFVSRRPIEAATKFTVNQNQNQSTQHLTLQSDRTVSCICTTHKLKCMRLCMSERKYVKKLHKRMPIERSKSSKIHAKDSTLIFGGGGGGSSSVWNNNGTQSNQRNHAFPSSEMSAMKSRETIFSRIPIQLHGNHTIPSNVHRMNHYIHATSSDFSQLSATGVDPIRRVGLNIENIQASNSNQMLLFIVNADESAAAMNASAKHNRNDVSHEYKIGHVKRKIRSISMPSQPHVDGLTKEQTTLANEMTIGSTFNGAHLQNNTLTVSSK